MKNTFKLTNVSAATEAMLNLSTIPGVDAYVTRHDDEVQLVVDTSAMPRKDGVQFWATFAMGVASGVTKQLERLKRAN